MTKTQLWEEVSKLLEDNKASKKLKAGLEELLRPKSGGGNVQNPPKEIDGEMHYYCRFHQEYEPEKDMVMSKDKEGNLKSKGYCKASISKWNKLNKQIKDLEHKAVEAMGEGNFDEAQEFAKEAKEVKAILNKPETYNLGEDWATFNA